MTDWLLTAWYKAPNTVEEKTNEKQPSKAKFKKKLGSKVCFKKVQ